MEKQQGGVDGDPCSKKRRIDDEGVILSDKDIVPRQKLGARAIQKYYDSSAPCRITRIHKDELFYFTQLAIWSYNLKEDTNFYNVEVLRAKIELVQGIFYYITFTAFSPQGVATTFQTKIHFYIPSPCSKIEFIFVRIVPDDSDDFAENSKIYRPSIGHPKDRPYKKRLQAQINDPQFQLPVYLSQYALINYNIINLRVHAARHDIPSLKVVKPMERVGKQTAYLLTFEASLCDDTNKVETFQTEIYIPALFPTTTIEFWDFKKIN